MANEYIARKENVSRPSIALSTADYERLSALARAARNRLPGLAAELADEIGRAEVFDKRELPPHVVCMNSEVKFRDDTIGKVRTVRLVYPEEADISEGRTRDDAGRHSSGRAASRALDRVGNTSGRDTAAHCHFGSRTAYRPTCMSWRAAPPMSASGMTNLSREWRTTMTKRKDRKSPKTEARLSREHFARSRHEPAVAGKEAVIDSNSKRELDRRLDDALKETFPASDPISIVIGFGK